MRLRLLLLAAAVAAAATTAASAGPPGQWTRIARQNSGARANLGLARGKDGRLHVLWAGPGRSPYTSILDTTISPAGVVGAPRALVSGWSGVNPPAAAVAPDGSIHVVISGQKTGRNDDPYNGLNEAVGPAWRLGAHAFGTAGETLASNAIVAAGILKDGRLITVWRSAGSLLMLVGSDPAAQPQNITPPGLADNPTLAVDQASGEAVIAYHRVADGQNAFRRVYPSLGPPRPLPGAKLDAPQIAARIGGGIYTAYTPDGKRVWLLRDGGQPKAVPVPKGVQVLTAGLAAGPEGRLWVFYGDSQHTYVTRTSKAVGGFEPVQTLGVPQGLGPFRLEGEGSVGPLDLFSDVLPASAPKDGTYHTHVLPALSLVVSRAGKRLTARVTDAGDPVAGARVAFAGGVRTTDAHGAVALPAVQKGGLTLTATKPGYVPAKTRLP